jgi:chromosomal replication initiator protein
MNIEDSTWKTVLAVLEKQVNRPAYELLIKRIRPVRFEDGALEVTVPASVSLDSLGEYLSDIEAATSGVLGTSVRLSATHHDEPEPEEPARPAPRMREPRVTEAESIPSARRPFLNPKYTFDSFIVGSSNRLCNAASLAVAEAPGQAYNPLFIYGGVGLGKTHLMQAIGHYVNATRPTLRVEYITTDAFINDLMNYIQSNRLVEFRNRYQKPDVLLIDDIQFLQGKDRTQYEFFQIFNSFYEARKQIVTTCDRLPKDIPTLEDRMITRLNSGLLADIKAPDFETRLAILLNKARADGVTIPDAVMDRIANSIISNIRDLEGTLTRLIAYSNLSDRPITIELADEILRDVAPSRDPSLLTVQQIMKDVAAYYSVDIEDLTGKRRTKEIVLPRMVAMFLTREFTKLSLSSIGKEFGNKDHTTVLYSIEKIDKDLQQDTSLRQALENLRGRLVG